MNYFFGPENRREDRWEDRWEEGWEENSEWGWIWDERRCCFRLVRRCRHRRHDDCNRRHRFHNDRKRDRFRQHVHEFLGSTRIAEAEEEPHNHRFAGVTGPAIPAGNSHVHRIETLTDNTDHTHRIEDTTGEAIDVGGGRHVHLVRGETTFEDGHRHEYIFATLIENPLGNEN